MRRLLMLLTLLLCGVVTAAEFSAIGGGEFNLAGRSFSAIVWHDGWKGTVINRKTLEKSANPLQKTATGQKITGKLPLSLGEAVYEEQFSRPAENRCAADIRLSGDVPLKITALCLRTMLPKTDYQKGIVSFDGKEYLFADGQKTINVNGKTAEVRLPVKGGFLRLRGEFKASVMDVSDTSYAPDKVQVRVMPFAAPREKETSLAFTADFVQVEARPLDLRPAMNMGLVDDLAEDNKGGWTDQGAGNDLRMLNPGTADFDNVRFTVVDAEKNDGKACISLKGSARQYFPVSASADFTDNPQGKYLYLLHATAWDAPANTAVGTVKCVYADNSESSAEILSKVNVANFWQPQPLSQATVGWRGGNDIANVGLYVARLPLKNLPLKRISFNSAGTSVWMVVAASLADDKIPSAAPVEITLAADNREWFTLPEEKPITRGSVLDFSYRLDAPAGKYGFAKNLNGQIVFEKNPRPQRFYGANLCFSANYMEDKAQIDRMADDFAAIGYNFVRFHHFDRDCGGKKRTGDGTDFLPELLDRFDYTLAAFKKRGIYVTMDLFISRVIGKGQIPGYPQGMDRHSYKALVWADSACRENFLNFSRKLLTHVNPYTGIAWKDEPAIINLDLVNEDGFHCCKGKVAKPVYEKLFREYAQKQGWKFSPYERDRYWNRFLAEFYPKAYQEVVVGLRKIGAKQMCCDMNHVTDMLTKITRQPYDIVEMHFYWCHPSFLKGSWGLPAGVQNASAIAKFGGALASVFHTRDLKLPFSVTEWDFVHPNRYNAEGAFLTGAYGALQDWGGLCRFSYAHSQDGFLGKDGGPRFFDLAHDPLRKLSERAGVLFFLREDVKPSAVTVPTVINRNHFARENASAETGVVANHIGLIAKTGNLVIEPEKSPALPYKGAIYCDRETGKWLDKALTAVDGNDHRNALGKLEQAGVLPAKSGDPLNGIFRSTTGELELNAKQITFKAVTSKSEGFVMEGKRTLAGNFASVDNRKNFAAFLCASRDDRPLTESGRLLLLHLTDVKGTGSVFGDEDMTIVLDHGKFPLLVRKGDAEITLNRNFRGFKLYPLDLGGNRLTPVNFKVENGKTVIGLDTSKALAWELVKE